MTIRGRKIYDLIKRTGTISSAAMSASVDGNLHKKRNTVIGTIIGILMLAVLAISVVTLIKVYSAEPTQVISPNQTLIKDLNLLNVPERSYLKTDLSDPKYVAYDSYVKRLKNSVNVSFNPCNDFYSYACGSLPPNTPSVSVELKLKTLKQLAQQLSSHSYINADDLPLPVKQAAIHYEKCIEVGKDVKRAENGPLVVQKILNLQNRLGGVGIPALQSGTTDLNTPSRAIFSAAIGYLSYAELIDTFISTFTETNWKNPQGAQPYVLYLDKAQLRFANKIYLNNNWDKFKQYYMEDIVLLFKAFAKYSKLGKINEEKLTADVNAIIDLEFKIATINSNPNNNEPKHERNFNLYTLEKANQHFPEIDWSIYLGEATQNRDITQKPFVIGKPDALRKTLDYLKSNKVAQRTIYNYLYYRVLFKNQLYLPNAVISERNQKIVEKKFATIKARSEATQYDDLKVSLYNNIDNEYLAVEDNTQKDSTTIDEKLQIVCAEENQQLLRFANARAYIDAVYPNSGQRNELRQNVATFVKSVIDAFKGMLQQLNWLSPNSRMNALNKIANLVKNIGYPDFVLNDNALKSYYESLKLDSTTSYAVFVHECQKFHRDIAFKQLLTAKEIDRLDFKESAAVVNSWYQAPLNSITLPLAIIQQPYYDPSYPNSVNYGAFGSIVGHQITHAFDSIGIQWDGVGALSEWLDESSLKGFNEMSHCILSQYSEFNAGDEVSLNSVVKQNENIADNGGIQASYRAYQTQRTIKGADPQLPDKLYSQFSHDQLFFLSFAQVFCESKDSANLKKKITAPKKRVLGSLLNIPAFQAAYNCPVNSAFTSKKHCNVWVSSSKGEIGLSSIPGNNDDNTVQDPIPSNISPNIAPPPVTRSKLYQKVSNFIEKNINTVNDPCNKFYEYACEGSVNSNVVKEDFNSPVLGIAIAGLSEAVSTHDLTSVQTAKYYFQSCVSANLYPTLQNRDGKKLDYLVNDLRRNFMPFPLVGDPIKQWPSKSELTYILNRLSFWVAVDTLVTPYVHYNWNNPQLTRTLDKQKSSILHLDQPTLVLPQDVYSRNDWEVIANAYNEYVSNILWRYVILVKKQFEITREMVIAEAKRIVIFERLIAVKFMDPYTGEYRVNNVYNTNPFPPRVNSFFFNVTDFMPYKSYVKEISQIVIDHPAVFDRMSNLFSPKNQYGLDVNLIYNYLHYRVLVKYINFLPSTFEDNIVTSTSQTQLDALVDRPKYTKHSDFLNVQITDQIMGRPKHVEKTVDLEKNRSQLGIVNKVCATEVLNELPEVGLRVILDQIQQKRKMRDLLKKNVGNLAKNVIDAYRDMITESNWLKSAKTEALSKLKLLVVNIGYPEYVFENWLLNGRNYIDLSNTTDYAVTRHEILYKNRFYKFIKLFNDKPADRTYFDNANPLNEKVIYLQSLNSISIPFSLLMEPFYNPDLPASINYAALGNLIGNAIAQAFDTKGIQWNAIGELNQWMDTYSTRGYRWVALCLSKQNEKNCLVDNCLRKEAAANEILIDSTGVEAAFRAFKKYTALNKMDRRLPGKLTSKLTADQLFFLRYAQSYCNAPTTEHSSPANYRLLASLQNLPAFRSAFNCPIGKAYAPADRCTIFSENQIFQNDMLTMVTPIPVNISPRN